MRIVEDHFICFLVRTEPELHPVALEVGDDEGSAQIRTQRLRSLDPGRTPHVEPLRCQVLTGGALDQTELRGDCVANPHPVLALGRGGAGGRDVSHL